MKKILYIYRITNLINSKKYIGKHSSDVILNRYYGSGIAIKKAIFKYGKESFRKDVICICESEDELNLAEIFNIEKEGTFLKGYNMTKGGEGILGHKWSKEAIAKGALSRKKYYEEHPEAIERMSNFAKTRTGDKNSFYGKKLSAEHIEKMRKARVIAITGANNPSAVRVLCVEENREFSTAKEAALFCGLVTSTTILKCAKGQRKSAEGYTWKIIKNEI